MADPHDKSEDGNYVVVARRYRPRGFDELVGQEHVCRALVNAIETNRVGHAYLFTGARGVGKTSAARIFAKALNNESGPSATPDNESDVALAIDAGQDVDVIEIDGASNRGIDEIRSLRANIGVRPSRARYKIYIIDEVHMLTTPAFNALLKTLEEPPEHAKFIFCTTDPERLPITVLSRCQRFDFAPVEVPKIVHRLREIITAESAEADDAALELLARRAAGSMRDSQSLLEQVLSFSHGRLSADQVHAMLGTADDVRLHALASAMADRDTSGAMRILDESIDAGIDAGRLAEQLLCYFRDLMAVTVDCAPSLLRHTSASLHPELKQLGDRWGLQTVLAVVGLIDQTLVRIRHSVYSRVLLESTLIQICNLPDLQHISDLAAAASDAALPSNQKKKPALAPPKTSPRSDGPTAESRRREPAAAQQANQTNSQPNNDTPPRGTAPDLQGSTTGLPTTQTEATGQSRNQAGTAEASLSERSVPSQTEDEKSANDKTSAASTSTDQGNPQHDIGAASPWTQPEAQRVWQAALGDLESMTEAFARMVSKVVAVGTQQLRLEFPANGNLAMRRCELPEHRSTILQAVSKRAGRDITLEYYLAESDTAPKKSVVTSNKPSRIQRMREIEANELVRSCIDLFNAEIVRIDKAN
jgi:DNA polymerase-3 subunit gamma/tau